MGPGGQRAAADARGRLFCIDSARVIREVVCGRDGTERRLRGVACAAEALVDVLAFECARDFNTAPRTYLLR